jgi:CRP/FNR family transcriptional regulator, anaerobic regulatory protein
MRRLILRIAATTLESVQRSSRARDLQDQQMLLSTLTHVARVQTDLGLLNRLGAAHTDGLGAALPQPMRQRVASGETLAHEGAVAQHIFVVQAGTFKCVKTAMDGYDHVLSFALRGDVLGYDGLATGHYASAAVALEDSFVLAVPLAQLDAMRHADEALDHALQTALSRQLAHAIELAELMSAVAADARLARFLLHWSERMGGQGLSPRRLLLRMNRRDIAAHLGLAHETISRCFGLLSERGHVKVNNRDVEILDFDGLRLVAHSTRGAGDDAPDGKSASLGSRGGLSRSFNGLPVHLHRAAANQAALR